MSFLSFSSLTFKTTLRLKQAFSIKKKFFLKEEEEKKEHQTSVQKRK